MEKPEVKPAVCEVGQGTLPGCAALAFPYIPMQSNNPTRYSRTEALQTGTLFPGLDLPFKAAIQARTKLQAGIFQSAEGGAHFFNDHLWGSSPFSRAARP